jgi:hypothetical protein
MSSFRILTEKGLSLILILEVAVSERDMVTDAYTLLE